jgi:hypothetical protein
LLLRRAAVLEAGGLFDPAFFMFFEDTDLGQRLRRAGWQLRVAPQAQAWHGWRNRPEKAAMMASAERSYLQRYHPWGDRVQRWLVPRLAADAWRRDDLPVPLLSSASMAREQLGAFWAITPLPTLHPAAVRSGAAARAMSDQEWELLDPGRWYVWVERGAEGMTRRSRRDWVRVDIAKA